MLHLLRGRVSDPGTCCAGSTRCPTAARARQRLGQSGRCTTGNDFLPNHMVDGIDYASIHMWPDNWGRTDLALWPDLARRAHRRRAVPGQAARAGGVWQDRGCARHITR